MNSENPNFKQRFCLKHIYRFLGGAALGAFIAIIPISYGSSTDLNWVQISIALLLVLSCGVLSSIWGEKFIDAVMNTLNSFAA
jgi:hypothetical protein